MGDRQVSQRRACVLIGVDPKTVRRERPPDHADIREEMREIAGRRRRFGYRRVGVMLARKPQQNAFIESFNGSLRDELLNEEVFDSLADARRKLAVWRYDYNNVMPHSSLANRTPAQARRAFLQDGGVTPGALVPVGQHEYQTGRLSL